MILKQEEVCTVIPFPWLLENWTISTGYLNRDLNLLITGVFKGIIPGVNIRFSLLYFTIPKWTFEVYILKPVRRSYSRWLADLVMLSSGSEVLGLLWIFINVNKTTTTCEFFLYQNII